MKLFIILIAILIVLLLLFLVILPLSIHWPFKLGGKEDFEVNNQKKLSIIDIRNNPKKYFQGDREPDEQLLVLKYLPTNSKVLELGGRTGTVSKAINLILDDKSQHLVVDPSSDIDIIKNLNKLSSSLGFKVFNGAIGKSPVLFDGYSSKTAKNFKKNKLIKIQTLTIDQILKKYNIPFTAIIADCEGCVSQLIDDFPQFLNQILHINIEYDMSIKENERIANKLVEAGFKSIAKRKFPYFIKRGMGRRDGTGFEVWQK